MTYPHFHQTFLLLLLLCLLPHTSAVSEIQYLSDEKIVLVTAYHSLLDWRRDDTDTTRPLAQLLSRAANGALFEGMIINAMGDNFDLIDEFEAAHPLTTSQIKLAQFGRGTMELRAFTWFFRESVFHQITVEKTVRIRSGVCSRLIADAQTPPISNLIEFSTDIRYSSKPSRHVIAEYLGVLENEKGLKKSVKRLIDEGREVEFLGEIQTLCAELMNSPWVNDETQICSKHKPEVEALLVLEDQVYQRLPDSEHSCYDKVEFTGNEMNMSPQHALDKLGNVLRDDEVVRAAFPATQAATLTSQLPQLRRITNSTLALLSLPVVRGVITGAVPIVQSIEQGSCKLQDKLKALRRSVTRIRALLPSGGNRCVKEMEEKSYVPKASSFSDNQVDWHFLRNNIDALGAKELFGMTVQEFRAFYWSPYVGLPFQEMPVKHALWWLAADHLPYYDCNGVEFVTRFIEQEEEFSKRYYMVDHAALDVGCGLLQEVNTEESFVLAVKQRAILLYEMFRKYNFTHLVRDLEVLGDGYEANIKTYEKILLLFYSRIYETKLEIDPALYEVEMAEYGVSLQNLNVEGVDLENELLVGRLVERGAVCEMFQYQKSQVKLHKNQIINFLEGRRVPFAHEQQVYSNSRGGIEKLNRREMAGCQVSPDTDVDLFVQALDKFLKCSFVRNSPVFNSLTRRQSGRAYLSGSEPGIILQNHLKLKDISNFQMRVDLRLDGKTGTPSADVSMFDDLDHFTVSVVADADNSTRELWEQILQLRDCLLKHVGIFPQSNATALLQTGEKSSDGDSSKTKTTKSKSNKSKSAKSSKSNSSKQGTSESRSSKSKSSKSNSKSKSSKSKSSKPKSSKSDGSNVDLLLTEKNSKSEDKSRTNKNSKSEKKVNKNKSQKQKGAGTSKSSKGKNKRRRKKVQ